MNFFKKMSVIFCAGMFFSQGAAAEEIKAPVILELFSATTCKFDPKVQEYLLEKIKNDSEIYLVNCSKSFQSKAKKTDKYANKLCDERAAGYFRKLTLFTVNTPMLIANGILEANNNNPGAAIDAARSMIKPEKINVSLEGDAVNIYIPSLKTKVKKGKVMIYGYLPTQNSMKVTEIDPDAELDDQMREDIKLGKSVPFVTQKRISPLRIRPVVGISEPLNWNGGEMSFSYPVSKIDTFHDEKSSVSYIVVLHEEDEFGAVLAVGEWKAFPDIDSVQSAAMQESSVLASFPDTSKK
jgi:hypothetical protein